MTQPNITALPDPAGAVNDAAILGASTSAPSLVFKPGVVFSNNGPIRQNVYTSPNSSGTDGFVLLQQTLQGQGFFPIIPLPSSNVEIDCSSNANTFLATSNTSLGNNCHFHGLPNPSTGVLPTFQTGNFTLSPPTEINNVLVVGQTATGQIFSSNPATLILSGQTKLTAGAVPYWAPSAATSLVTMIDGAVFGDGTHSNLATSGTAVVTFDCYDSGNIAAASITPPTGSSSVVINIYSTAFTVDQSLFGVAGITINNLSGSSSLFPTTSTLLTGVISVTAGTSSSQGVDLSSDNLGGNVAASIVLPIVGNTLNDTHAYFLQGAAVNSGNQFQATVNGGGNIASSTYVGGFTPTYLNGTWGVIVSFTWTYINGALGWVQN